MGNIIHLGKGSPAHEDRLVVTKRPETKIDSDPQDVEDLDTEAALAELRFTSLRRLQLSAMLKRRNSSSSMQERIDEALQGK